MSKHIQTLPHDTYYRDYVGNWHVITKWIHQEALSAMSGPGRNTSSPWFHLHFAIKCIINMRTRVINLPLLVFASPIHTFPVPLKLTPGYNHLTSMYSGAALIPITGVKCFPLPAPLAVVFAVIQNMNGGCWFRWIFVVCPGFTAMVACAGLKKKGGGYTHTYIFV